MGPSGLIQGQVQQGGQTFGDNMRVVERVAIGSLHIVHFFVRLRLPLVRAEDGSGVRLSFWPYTVMWKIVRSYKIGRDSRLMMRQAR
jgi:hypothetical protein